MADLEFIGWIATGLFTLSFLVKQEIWLLRLQMFSASLWIAYGVIVHAKPVIVANVLVATASAFRQIKLWRSGRTAKV